jgi:hypothetical protein
MLFDAVVNKSSATTVVYYLFCAFNSLQGFFIFLLLNLREKSVREAWHRLLISSRQSLVNVYTRIVENTSTVSDSHQTVKPYSQDTRDDGEFIQLRSDTFSPTVNDETIDRQRGKTTTKGAMETTVSRQRC